jgi:hypothetical protein
MRTLRRAYTTTPAAERASTHGLRVELLPRGEVAFQQEFQMSLGTIILIILIIALLGGFSGIGGGPFYGTGYYGGGGLGLVIVILLILLLLGKI